MKTSAWYSEALKKANKVLGIIRKEESYRENTIMPSLNSIVSLLLHEI